MLRVLIPSVLGSVCVPGYGTFIFLLPSSLAASSLGVLCPSLPFGGSYSSGRRSCFLSFRCDFFWVTLTVFCLVSRFLSPLQDFVDSTSFVDILSSSSGFSQSYGGPASGVLLRLVPLRFTFLVGDWSSSMPLLFRVSFLHHFLLPSPEISLSLLAYSLFLRYCGALGCPLLRSWCRFSLFPGLVAPWGVLLFLLGYLGASIPRVFHAVSAVLLSSWVSRPFIPGFRLPLRVALSFFHSRLSGYDLRFPFGISFYPCPLPVIFGVWLPCLLSLPFQ